MYKISIFIVLFCLIGSCKTLLNKTIDKDNSKLFDITYVNCRIPLNITADSLAKIIQYETVKRFEGSYSFLTYDSFSIKQTLIAKKNIPKLDEALNKCQNYLLQKLGSYFYCNYLFLTHNSIYSYDNENTVICFGFSMPNLKSNIKSAWADSLLDETSFCFYLPYHKDGSLEIIYPIVPDCNNNKDCKFNISKQETIDTLVKVNYIKKNDNYLIILTDSFEWKVTKKTNTGEEEIKIDIRTGQISDIIYSHKID